MVEKSNIENVYKIYQLMDFFVKKYGFNNVLVKDLIAKNEIWLVNKENPEINIIRISTSSLDETYMDKLRIDKYIETIKKNLNNSNTFLDLHVSKEEVGAVEFYETTCLDSNYLSGRNLDGVFPGINYVVHDVSDQENEIALRINSINSSMRERIMARHNKIKSKIGTPVTYLIIAICLLMEITFLAISARYGESYAYVLLGVDYKLLTIGMHQYWRLITYGFLHGGLLHLFVNMYSLKIIGSYFENTYGSFKYLLMLLSGVIVGGLSHNIMAGNTFSIGLSGGIYTLFTMYIIDALSKGAYRSNAFMAIVFINIALNFTGGIAWQTHLGGAVVGLIYYMMFKDEKINYGMVGLLIVLIVMMFIKLMIG